MSGTPTTTVALGENLDVAASEAIHEQLREGLRSTTRLVLDAAKATEVDVTFLQMLVAAHRTAERAGKSIVFASPPSGALAASLARCGFTPRAGATSLAEILAL